MVSDLLVILDGASEPRTPGDPSAPTSLERARTPHLDALSETGSLRRLQTTPEALPAGSETGCSVLLGWLPPAPVDRGALEAAALGLALEGASVARRVDVAEGAAARASSSGTARAAVALEAPDVAVHRLAGHRLLLVGEPAAIDAALAAARASGLGALDLHEWPTGVRPPRRIGADTVVLTAPGAVLGLARLLGATTLVPAGISGDVDERPGPFAGAAAAAIGDGARRVVVHLGAPDEAAHRLAPAEKVAALEQADDEVIAPLAKLARAHQTRLTVAIDHGCDPRTGLHDDVPTPLLIWPAAELAPQAAGGEARRMTERCAAGFPVVSATEWCR